MTVKAPMDLCQRCGHRRMVHTISQCEAVTLQRNSAAKCACPGFVEPTGTTEPMPPDAVRWPHGVPHAGPVDPNIFDKVLEHTAPPMPRRNAQPAKPTAPGSPDVFTKRDSQPTIVCLCGSTRFAKAFADALLSETLAGKIVLTVGSMTHSDAHIKACIYCGLTPEAVVTDLCTAHLDAANSGNAHEFHPLDSKHHIGTKGKLDALHLRKIEMADEVLVLNVIACKYCRRARAEHMTTPGGFACSQSSSPVPDDEMRPYIGDSTRREIKHALACGKPVRFLNEQLIDQALWDQINDG